MIKVIFLLLAILNIYADTLSDKNINSHNPYNYSYQTHNFEDAAVYLILDGLFHPDKFFDSDKKDNKSELKTDFEYLEKIDKNMKEESE